ncbi:MAG: cysteine-rich CWC family protein [Burkholderiales bacterium]|nr:cysteine-rich CWC family protein [Burkholderiales bacterium]MDE2298042.1 cysteine-rich CWC family protein [Burkholderiales bacterium]MDE2627344.1 cysteine-rich CWC family protein [Burkholderiales bacterium]
MDVGANSICPRCGAGFHCGVNDAQPCECSALTLEPAALQALRERFCGCLCSSCLQHLQRERQLPVEAVRVGNR